MKFDRVLSILVSLLSEEHVTAAGLSARFGVSVRTIYRDIQSLEEAGVPVVSRQGQGGGIDLVEGFTLARQLLKSEEIDRLNGALKGLLRVLPDSFTESSVAKIAAVIPETRKTAYFYFDMNPWTATDLAEVPLQRIYDYCRRHMLLRIAYRDNKGGASTRDIEPMTLVYRGSSWYLFAWCRNRADYRLFRLAAIEKLEPAGERFQPRPGTYESIVLAREDEADRIAVRIRFDAEVAHVAANARNAAVLERKTDGSVLAEVLLREDDIMPYCGSWGARIEVLSPERIRDALIADARSRLKKYGA